MKQYAIELGKSTGISNRLSNIESCWRRMEIFTKYNIEEDFTKELNSDICVDNRRLH